MQHLNHAWHSSGHLLEAELAAGVEVFDAQAVVIVRGRLDNGAPSASGEHPVGGALSLEGPAVRGCF